MHSCCCMVVSERLVSDCRRSTARPQSFLWPSPMTPSLWGGFGSGSTCRMQSTPCSSLVCKPFCHRKTLTCTDWTRAFALQVLQRRMQMRLKAFLWIPISTSWLWPFLWLHSMWVRAYGITSTEVSSSVSLLLENRKQIIVGGKIIQGSGNKKAFSQQ